MLQDLGIYSSKLLKKLIHLYRTHTPNISLEPDALEFLKKALGKHKLSLITDGTPQTQHAKIAALGIEKYFNRIIVTDELGIDCRKPNPASFKLIQGEIYPESFLYIGDNPIKDFIAPNALNWSTSYRIKRPRSLHYELQTPPYCKEINSLSKLTFR